MRLKDDSVNVADLVPQLRDKLPVMDRAYAEFNTEMVITSGKDGVHGNNSLHYQGKAVDLRIWNVLQSLVGYLQSELGPDFEVILEKDHIHIEYDPHHDQVIG
jgi:hypothetical protein